jgi:FRG domain
MPAKKPRSIKTVEVSTLAQFAKAIETMQAPGPLAGNWYRGVGLADTYKLEPGLYRHPAKKKIEELVKLEWDMLNDFERFSILHTESVDMSPDNGGLKKLFFMQHYGIPTRLLDWSSNPFIALYFALSTAHFAPGATIADEDAAVWVLNPTTWNAFALGHIGHGSGGPLDHDEAATSYGPRKHYSGVVDATAFKTLGDQAACLLGVTNSARMFAQRGVFTVFGKDLKPMEEQYALGGYQKGTLNKISIPKARVGDLLASVIKLGYTDSVSYPDLHGLALEIKRQRGFRL